MKDGSLDIDLVNIERCVLAILERTCSLKPKIYLYEN